MMALTLLIMTSEFVNGICLHKHLLLLLQHITFFFTSHPSRLIVYNETKEAKPYNSLFYIFKCIFYVCALFCSTKVRG